MTGWKERGSGEENEGLRESLVAPKKIICLCWWWPTRTPRCFLCTVVTWPCLQPLDLVPCASTLLTRLNAAFLNPNRSAMHKAQALRSITLVMTICHMFGRHVHVVDLLLQIKSHGASSTSRQQIHRTQGKRI